MVTAAAVALAAAAMFAWQLSLPAASEIPALQMLAGAAHDGAAQWALERAAWSGSNAARLALGQVLITRGTQDEANQGVQWLQRAAAAGEPSADLALGKAWLKGMPALPADHAAARRHLQAAATRGNAGAAYYLGLMYRDGSGMPRDAAQAAHWLQQAAQAGVPAAMFMLANMFIEGDGVQADHAQARIWLERAAELEHPEACQMMAMGLRDGTMGFEKNEKLAALQLMEAAHSLRHRPPDP